MKYFLNNTSKDTVNETGVSLNLPIVGIVSGKPYMYLTSTYGNKLIFKNYLKTYNGSLETCSTIINGKYTYTYIDDENNGTNITSNAKIQDSILETAKNIDWDNYYDNDPIEAPIDLYINGIDLSYMHFKFFDCDSWNGVTINGVHYDEVKCYEIGAGDDDIYIDFLNDGTILYCWLGSWNVNLDNNFIEDSISISNFNVDDANAGNHKVYKINDLPAYYNSADDIISYVYLSDTACNNIINSLNTATSDFDTDIILESFNGETINRPFRYNYNGAGTLEPIYNFYKEINDDGTIYNISYCKLYVFHNNYKYEMWICENSHAIIYFNRTEDLPL